MAFLQHLNQTVKPLHHLPTAMILDDKRHLKLWMFPQVKELPRVEVGDEITVVLQRTTYQPVVQPFRQIM